MRLPLEAATALVNTLAWIGKKPGRDASGQTAVAYVVAILAAAAIVIVSAATQG